MILTDEYFQDSIVNYGFKPNALDYERSDDLLTRVNAIFEALGYPCEIRSGHRTREKTLALIASGHRAAVGGNHEQSLAVDVADPTNMADADLSDELLEQYGLYRESPTATASWVHLQSVPPKSGRRTFNP
jgi:hypothetical protein